MADTDAARLVDVQEGLKAVAADSNTRAKKSELAAAVSPLASKDGSNVEADAFRGAIGLDGIRIITQLGAKCDGVSDDTAAWELAALMGGKWLHPGGRSLISRQINFLKLGTVIEGPGAKYGAHVMGGASIVASSGFVGDVVVKFGDGVSAEPMRSVGMSNIEINCGTTSSAHGLEVNHAYDASKFSNITVLGVADGFNCFRFLAPDQFGAGTADVGQTIICDNLFGMHRNATNTAAAFYLYRQQECVFTNCKGWVGSSTSTPSATGDAWLVDSCNGVTLLNVSAVATGGVGIHITSTTKGAHGISVINPTIEGCKAPLRVSTASLLMFGTITTVPAKGSYVRQPSGARGRVWLATGAGVYVIVTAGTFANGALYADDGATNIGTLANILWQRPRAIRWMNPRFLGATTGTVASQIEAVSDAQIDWPGDTEGVVPLLTIGKEVEGCEVVTPIPGRVTQAATNGSAVRAAGFGVIKASGVFAETGTYAYVLPPAQKGVQVTVINDVTSGPAYMSVYPNTADTIQGFAQPLLLFPMPRANASSITFEALDSTRWCIVGRQGLAIMANTYYFAPPGGQLLGIHAATFQPSFGDSGSIFYNSLSASVNLPELGTGWDGINYTFIKRAGAYLSLVPRAGTFIRGGDVGKALILESDGAQAHLTWVGAAWELTVSGTFSWEP